MSHTLVIMLVALFFSALFSGLEIAFVSADRLRFEMDVERHTFSSTRFIRSHRTTILSRANSGKDAICLPCGPAADPTAGNSR